MATSKKDRTTRVIEKQMRDTQNQAKFNRNKDQYYLVGGATGDHLDIKRGRPVGVNPTRKVKSKKVPTRKKGR